MIDIQKLKALAEAVGKVYWHKDAFDVQDDDIEDYCVAHCRSLVEANFIADASPAAVLEMIAEIERQAAQFKEWQASHHVNYCAAADERDQLKAENFDLHATLQAAKGEIERLKAENEALRKDARRWQCVRNAIPMQSPYAVWREGSHLVLGKDADELVDNFLSRAKEASHD